MARNLGQEEASALQMLVESIRDLHVNGIISRSEARALLLKYGVLTDEDIKASEREKA